MAWMRAVTGSWNTVKQSQAYKMVRAYMLHGYRVPKRARGLGIFCNYDNFEPWVATSIYKQGIAVSTIVYSPATFPLPLLLQKFVTVAGGGGGGRVKTFLTNLFGEVFFIFFSSPMKGCKI